MIEFVLIKELLTKVVPVVAVVVIDYIIKKIARISAQNVESVGKYKSRTMEIK